jgi:hypothetical protein
LYLCQKPERLEFDRDRVDWTITYIFKDRQAKNRGAGGVSRQVRELLADLPTPKLSETADTLLSELAALLSDLSGFRNFDELHSSGIIARGRELKEDFKEEFFHPEVLSAVVNYNLMFSKKFDQLFKEASSQMHGEAQRLAQKDYRYTAGDFQKLRTTAAPTPPPAPPLALETPAPPPPPPPPPPPTPPPAAEPEEATPLDKMRALGIDPSREAQKLRFVTQNAAAYVRAAGNRQVTVIPLPHAELQVPDWEARALAADYPSSDKTFRAEFCRRIRHAVGLLAQVSEELAQYQKKRGTEYLWKPHYDSLIWLLYEGRQYIESLYAYAEATERSGLQEKAAQIGKTAQRLDECLDQLATIF